MTDGTNIPDKRARAMGWNAYYQRKPRSANPFPEDSPQAGLWYEGWDASEAQDSNGDRADAAGRAWEDTDDQA